MGTLVRSCIAFGAHAEISLLGRGSPLYSTSMSSSKSLILLLNFMLAISLGLPCICQYVTALSWVLLALLSLMLASLTLIISHIVWSCLMSSQAEPFYISFAAWFPILYLEGTFPRVSLSYTCFPALSIGMFRCLELVWFLANSFPPYCTISNFILFQAFQYEKDQKNHKT